MEGHGRIFVSAMAAGLVVWSGFEAWAGGAAQNGQAAGAGTAIDLKAGLWDSLLHISTILPETNVDTPELEKQLAKLSPRSGQRRLRA
jgi:hypothetical protein